MIDRFAKFSFAISTISRYWHKIASDEMEQHGLRGPHAVYFTTMYCYPDGITSSRLAEICSRDKSDVSRAISQFEEKGLVEKADSSHVNYRAPLRLTESGRRIAEHINQSASIAVENGGKGLSDEEREIFYNALEIITENLKRMSEKSE